MVNLAKELELVIGIFSWSFHSIQFLGINYMLSTMMGTKDSKIWCCPCGFHYLAKDPDINN